MTVIRPGWQTIKVATQNAGNMTPAQAVKVAREADVVCWQEMGDRADIVRALRADGLKVWTGRGKPGQASTPISWHPTTLRAKARITIPLLGAVRWGRGAGPSVAKPKHLIGARFVHLPTRRRVIVCSTHLPPTQGRPLRRRAAQTMSRKIAAALGDRAAIVLVGMDANATRGKPGIRPLEAVGWTWTQAEQPTPTHGKRGIDGIWWRKRDRARLRLVDVRTIPSKSDHDAAVATFQIKEK